MGWRNVWGENEHYGPWAGSIKLFLSWAGKLHLQKVQTLLFQQHKRKKNKVPLNQLN